MLTQKFNFKHNHVYIIDDKAHILLHVVSNAFNISYICCSYVQVRGIFHTNDTDEVFLNYFCHVAVDTTNVIVIALVDIDEILLGDEDKFLYYTLHTFARYQHKSKHYSRYCHNCHSQIHQMIFYFLGKVSLYMIER